MLFLLRHTSFRLVLAAFLFAAPTVRAQVCESDIQIENQAQVDAFDCTEVQGYLLISGADIVDLAPLSELTTVGQLLIVDNPVLASLSGLEGLTSFPGHLRVERNDALTSLDGLDNISTVGSQPGYGVTIRSNPVLTSLAGLESLTTVHYLQIHDNPALTSIEGLESLTSASANVGIGNNVSLTSLAGLESLTSVNGLAVRNNENLASLAGLEGLSSNEGYLVVENNSSLQSVDGLEGLPSLGGRLQVRDNTVLQNLDGLANISSIGSSLTVQSNYSLAECTVGLGNLLANGGIVGAVTISDNAPGCNSVCEVQPEYEGCTVDTEDEATPLVTGLAAPYPNPTIGAATLTYSLAEAGAVTLTLYDALGRRVRALAEGPQSAGAHEVTLEAGLPAGTYVLRFEAGGEKWTERVTVVR